MIDITFQLMSFFMFVLNFSDAEQNELIQLPESELAKPSEAVLEYPITLHLTAQGRVLGPVAAKLTAAAGELQQAYNEINNAVCAAK